MGVEEGISMPRERLSETQQGISDSDSDFRGKQHFACIGFNPCHKDIGFHGICILVADGLLLDKHLIIWLYLKQQVAQTFELVLTGVYSSWLALKRPAM